MKIVPLLILFLTIFLIQGCGGASATSIATGTYRADLSAGVLLISSDSIGDLRVTLTNTTASTSGYSGSGALDADGSLNLTASRPDGSTITVQGAITSLGFTGTVSGAVTATGVTGTKIGDGTSAPFTGSYIGNLVGRTATGSATITVTSPNTISLNSTGNIIATLNGSILASGIWTATGSYILGGTTYGVTVTGVLAPNSGSTTIYGYGSVVNVSNNAVVDSLSITFNQ